MGAFLIQKYAISVRKWCDVDGKKERWKKE